MGDHTDLKQIWKSGEWVELHIIYYIRVAAHNYDADVSGTYTQSGKLEQTVAFAQHTMKYISQREEQYCRNLWKKESHIYRIQAKCLCTDSTVHSGSLQS